LKTQEEFEGVQPAAAQLSIPVTKPAVGAENPVRSCDVQILVHETTEPVSA
jgi:hypothetical protein